MFREKRTKLPVSYPSSIVTLSDERTSVYGYIVIDHSAGKRPAFGATRIWSYATDQEALDDAISLARIMSYKSVMAGYSYAGAKAVLHTPETKEVRSAMLARYGEYVSMLGGSFVTGADVGIDSSDLASMNNSSQYIVGTQVDPVEYTAQGVFEALKVCLKRVYDEASLSSRTFAIQGLGKTGWAFMSLLVDHGAKEIFVSDLDEARMQRAAREFSVVKPVHHDEIHAINADVYSPCAVSHSLNKRTIRKLRCRMVVGSANNQLENTHIDQMLHRMKILYAPDFIVNAGGLMAVVDEYEHKTVSKKRIQEKMKGIAQTMKEIIEASSSRDMPTGALAVASAQHKIAELMI